jgi:hypothetical protein
MSREYPSNYPIYLAVRITEKQNKKLMKEVKKGKTQSDVIRTLIDNL